MYYNNYLIFLLGNRLLDYKNIESAQKLILNVIEKLKIPCVIVTHDTKNLEVLNVSQEINFN